MKLFYKNVGDEFTLDEYNAMCYLLSLQTYSETFVLGYDTYKGTYADYTLQDDNDSLVETTNGFKVNKKHKSFKINLNKYIPNAIFTITLEVYKNDTTIDKDNITSTIYSNELYDNIEDNVSYEKATLEKIQIKESGNTISIKPQDFDLKKGDWINKNVTLTAKYSEPIVNWEDGSANTEDQILCETFADLENVIHNSPNGSYLNIKLRGNQTYTFTKEIVIKNKNVTIEGGNPTNKRYAILDAQDLYRHFYVGAGCTLKLNGCTLKNGNGSIINTSVDATQRGGSIFMDSRFTNISGVYTFQPSVVDIQNCIFSNCHANRGGAICNSKGKLSCYNVSFYNCVATKDGDRTACWGGAILNESVTMYHDSSNQLYVDKSLTTLNSDNTVIDLKISTTQNLKHFIDSSYRIPTLTCIHGNNEYTVTSVKSGQFEYILTINGALTNGSKFYLKCNDFITRNLKIIKEGNDYYTIVA